ncbi:barstar family protein [Chryseobacterium sp. CFBP8996]|uniref:barstar family protein n=1 Tax=Chryseobacterium sp. CFBP8996 TaxID=3096529 RepID=UPI002A6A4DA0|nr:barstar family protein [Chryseobacterium sp. CFBP8996]MDY0930816.1 barstar family protein [Chryseobacterium sp. CFBP8996]
MQILLNDKYLGINYINLKRNENIIEDKLVLRVNKEDKLNILDQIEHQGKLNISVESRKKNIFCLYDITFITNYIYSEEESINDEDILLETVVSNNIIVTNRAYNQFVFDIFYNWNQNIEIIWSQITNLEIKTSYIEACYLWNSQFFEILNIDEVQIQGELIKCREDLFYYLGEKLIGKRGYFGGNLDSLEDFLIDVAKNNIINTCLTFSYIDNIIENTNKYFFETVIHLLEKAKFKIKFRE